ncbi:MAG: twin-arginine translocase subunit TatC [Gemmataceae bacterium]|nr:twin-arginine translocase subunit TatC [Gemmataceae bacterium]
MRQDSPLPDPEDYFEPTRMPLGGHLEDLRLHLWRALVGFFLIVLLCFLLDLIGYLTGTRLGVGKPAVDWLCLPVEQELASFHDRRLDKAVQALLARHEGRPEISVELELPALARALAPLFGLKAPHAPPEGAPKPTAVVRARIAGESWQPLAKDLRNLVRPPRLATMSVTEAMGVYFKVTFVCAVVLASPWLFWQIWSFVAAGLYPHEKRYVHRFLPFSVGLFLAGVALCQLVVMPRAVEVLLTFNEWLELEPDLRLSEWLGFTLMMPLVFGVSFQTPLVMLMLERLGVLTVAAYQEKRRFAWFFLAVFAAIITPSVDLYSMLFLWVPLGLLYELGIWLCLLAPSRPAWDVEAEGAAEV